MAEPVGRHCTAHLHESLVGLVFRRKERHWRLVAVRPTNNDDTACDIRYPLLDANKDKPFHSSEEYASQLKLNVLLSPNHIQDK
jgi:hypothetical protein